MEAGDRFASRADGVLPRSEVTAMATERLGGSAAGRGCLVVRFYKGKPFYEAKWRDLERTAAQGPARTRLAGTRLRGRMGTALCFRGS